MTTVEMSFYIHAPIEQVFDAVSDHETFFRGGPIRSVRLTLEGSPERNGLGAVRDVRAGPLRFVEDITHYERPHRLDYFVRECTLPIEHEGGRLDFTARGEGTEIHWVSRFDMRTPIGRAALCDMMAMALTHTVTVLMHQVKARLEA